ncbi:uncharacterized protein [Typha angustifolia]|uniref:uncharacterized protein n=1 Tax=Typha angustifolia TaxID=59011 RepID=UPI003C2B78DA
MATKLAFTEEEMVVDENLGYPKAYSKLCKSLSVLSPYSQGPPFAFVPYVLQPQEALRIKDLNQMFPVMDPEAIPSVNPRGYVNLLWKQLDHLGNAGFDPALFRVDIYGNVLYLHADSASPLAWDIDHWFPCARGGRTVPSNLRILQFQVCKRKKNKLEFLIPWWDLQLGISVNQFLSIFASRNSDFRHRAFSFLFADGAYEELSTLQAVEAHAFPQHFFKMKKQVGLAPAAIVTTGSSDSSVLKPLDMNRSLRPNYPVIAARKFSGDKGDGLSMAVQNYSRPNISKENTDPGDDTNCNPYLSIAMARDSLRQREEAKKKQAEMNELEGELSELQQKNETERLAIQDLEALLIKRKRRVEKCRRLAEAQSSYKTLLEKMIRDAMHQSVVYKEQVRLNQAATSTLMARLEAQRAICDSSENELRRKYRQRDDIEKQIMPFGGRKRSRVDDTLLKEMCDESRKYLSVRTPNSIKKELREFLEEEQKASEAGTSLGEEGQEKLEKTSTSGDTQSDEMHNNRINTVIGKGKSILQSQEEEAEEQTSDISVRGKLEQLAVRETKKVINSLPQTLSEDSERNIAHGKFGDAKDKKLAYCGNTRMPQKNYLLPQSHQRDDEAYMNQVGKGNVEKWLQVLMENSTEGPSNDHKILESNTDEAAAAAAAACTMNSTNPQKGIKLLQLKPLQERERFPVKSETQQVRKIRCRANSMNETKCNDAISVGSSTTAMKGQGAAGGRKSFELKYREEKKPAIPRSESARGFRSLPSSPSMITGMRRGVECMGRKPKVIGDDDDDDDEYDDYDYQYSVSTANSNFVKTCGKAIKKAVKK